MNYYQLKDYIQFSISSSTPNPFLRSKLQKPPLKLTLPTFVIMKCNYISAASFSRNFRIWIKFFKVNYKAIIINSLNQKNSKENVRKKILPCYLFLLFYTNIEKKKHLFCTWLRHVWVSQLNIKFNLSLKWVN